MTHMTPEELAAEATRMSKMTPDERKHEMMDLEQKLTLLREMRLADEDNEAKAMYPNSGY